MGVVRYELKSWASANAHRGDEGLGALCDEDDEDDEDDDLEVTTEVSQGGQL